VSVVVPAYNRERFVGATIESVVDQTFDDWELIVFDDGSTDGTLEVARSYAERDQRIAVARGSNGGVATARNRGFALTAPTAQYVAFLDSDDLWEPDALQALVEMLDAHPEYVGAHGLARCVDHEGRFVVGDDLEGQLRSRRGFRDGQLIQLDRDEPTTFSAFVYFNWVVTPGTQLIRREIVADLGGFDPVTDPADDADLIVRLSRHGDLGYIDRPVLRWRRHPETLSNTSHRWRNAAGRMRFKTLTDPSNTREQLEVVCRAQRWWARAKLSTALEHLHGLAFAAAMREAVMGLDLYQAYFRARVTAEMCRARARWSKPKRLGNDEAAPTGRRLEPS
jgi:glycosyltransferase involved in cell wall biosynthesis